MKKILVIVAAAVALSGVVFAQGQNAPSNEPKPCQSDVKKLCPKTALGGLALYNCVKPNADKLSFECKDWLKEFDKKSAEAKVSCQADSDKYCKDVTPGNGAVAKCLKGNMLKLSRKCAEHLPSNANYMVD